MTRLTEQQFADLQAKRRSPDTSAPLVANPIERVDPVTIALAEPPQGKGRARSFIKSNGKLGHYTPEDTRRYEGRIRSAAWDAMRQRQPLEGPLELVLRAIYPIPKSWSKRSASAAITGETRPLVKPDIDNVCKAWADALNGIVYRDDSQIVEATLRKRYGPQALVVVTVKPVCCVSQ